MMDLMELAERCERAEGPSSELDCHIAVALNECQVRCDPFDGEPTLYRWCEAGSTNDLYVAPPYTRSHDAAMLVVDTAALWATGRMEEGPFARLCWPMPNGSYVGGYSEGKAATVPLSICAAALRAIARAQAPAPGGAGEGGVRDMTEDDLIWPGPQKCDCGEEYPMYGVAPHECYWRKGPEYAIGQSTLLPLDQWGSCFVPDLEDDETWADFRYPGATGTFYCPKCQQERYTKAWGALVARIGEPPVEWAAQGIEAQSDETPQEVRPEGLEPGGEAMRPMTATGAGERVGG